MLSQGSSVKHRSAIAISLLRGNFLLGRIFSLRVSTTRHLGKAAIRKERVYGALRLNWRHTGWRRDHFRGWGKLEGEVQLCLTSRECLKPKTCLAALLPEVCNMGELVLGESMGSGGPRSLRGHGG